MWKMKMFGVKNLICRCPVKHHMENNWTFYKYNKTQTYEADEFGQTITPPMAGLLCTRVVDLRLCRESTRHALRARLPGCYMLSARSVSPSFGSAPKCMARSR